MNHTQYKNVDKSKRIELNEIKAMNSSGNRMRCVIEELLNDAIKKKNCLMKIRSKFKKTYQESKRSVSNDFQF